MKLIISLILFITSTVIKAQIPKEYKEQSLKLESQFASKIDSTIQLSKNCTLTYSSNETFKCLHLTLKNGKIILLNILLVTNKQRLLELLWDKRIFFSVKDPNIEIVAYKISKKDGSKKEYLRGSVSW